MKNIFRTIHLYLSLAAGLVIAVVCFTGAMLVFEKEIQGFAESEKRQVEVGDRHLPLSDLTSVVKKNLENVQVNSIKIYGGSDKSIEVGFSIDERKIDKQDEKGERNREGQNKTAFVNPYTGEWLGQSEGRSPFFATMFSLHRWLLAGDTGKLIVGVSTVIFLFILITGIILWWPKTKEMIKSRLTMNWSFGWKRTNHDLHIVLGFYSAVFLFVFAFTGLAWSFKWFNDGIYWITNSENIRKEPPKSLFIDNASMISIDSVFQSITQRNVEYEFVSITFPKNKEGVFSATLLTKNAAHERATDQIFIDQYSGKIISENLYSDRNLGQRVRSVLYPIHVGSIAGMPGRIIGFVVCLLGVTFPITGVILWINRLRKKS